MIHDKELEILTDYKDGYGIMKLREKYKIGQGIVYKVLEKYKVPVRPKGTTRRLIDESEYEAIVELYNNGMSLEKIGLKYHTEKGTIKRVLLLCGVELRTSVKNKDISGSVFGKLTVIKKTNERNAFSNFLYLCRCECGNEKLMTTYDVRKCKSCGCERYNRDYMRLKDRRTLVLRYIFKEYKNSAKYRGHSFNLKFDDMLSVVNEPCYYCGDINTNKRIDEITKEEIYYTGIDRYVNSIGYQKDNIVPSCIVCNKMKGTKDGDEFIKLISKIHNNKRKEEVLV